MSKKLDRVKGFRILREYLKEQGLARSLEIDKVKELLSSMPFQSMSDDILLSLLNQFSESPRSIFVTAYKVGKFYCSIRYYSQIKGEPMFGVFVFSGFTEEENTVPHADWKYNRLLIGTKAVSEHLHILERIEPE